MPVEYEVDEERNFIHVRASGVFTDTDVLEFESAILKDERIQDAPRALFDATGVESMELSGKAINKVLTMEIATPTRFTKTESKSAMVFSDPEGLTLAAEFAQRADRKVLVFDDLEKAKKWLGV
ncbi:MAG: STAS/SEC14 domain-containing protein [Planctomycetes bacterium]|nr:STAS/SEC14 domain-containing protein [Planctomycetota bacterium]